MALNLHLTSLLAIAVSACSGTDTSHPSAGGTGAVGGSSSSGGVTNGGAATTTGGATLAASTGGRSSGGAPQVGGSHATTGGRTSLLGCSLRPEGDSMCSGATPHFMTCVGETPQNTGCKIRTIGDMTDTYCCP